MRDMALVLIMLCAGCALPGYRTLNSGVQGVVTLNGIPVNNARVTLSAKSMWHGESGPQIVFSNSNGEFNIFAWRIPSLGSLYHQPTILIDIDIEVDSVLYKGWSITKMDYANNGELGYNIKLSCELTNSLTRYEIKRGKWASGICRPLKSDT